MDSTVQQNDMPADVLENAIKAQAMLVQAQEYIIDCPEMMDMAADELRTIKNKYKELEGMRVSMTKPLDDSKKRIMDFFRTPLDHLKQAEGAIKRSMVTWTNHQEEIRRKAQAEADEKARKERERLAKQAEKAAEKGQDEKAEVLQTQAEATIAPVMQSHAAPKGINTVTTWSAEITDMNALAKGVADGTIPIKAIKADQTFLNQQARSLKEDMNWPGVRAVSKTGIAAR